jgi:hypothetical protein
MRMFRVLLLLTLFCLPAFSQRPSRPALMVPPEAPRLDYVADSVNSAVQKICKQQKVILHVSNLQEGS